MIIKSLEIGLKIQALRKNANITQEKLAEKCNVSWRTISNLEIGVVMPSLQVICDIAQCFDVSIDKLLNNKIINKPMSRIRKENQVIESIYQLDDKLLYHIEEYIKLLKKIS